MDLPAHPRCASLYTWRLPTLRRLLYPLESLREAANATSRKYLAYSRVGAHLNSCNDAKVCLASAEVKSSLGVLGWQTYTPVRARIRKRRLLNTPTIRSVVLAAMVAADKIVAFPRATGADMTKKLIAVASAWVFMNALAAYAQSAQIERRAVMQSNREASAAFSAIANGIMTPEVAKAHTQTMLANGAKMAVLFASGTDQNDPGLKPVIWTDAAGFMAANEKFLAAVRKAQAAVPNRIAMAEAMAEVQAACGACHQAYRVMPTVDPAAGRGGRGRGGVVPAAAPPAVAQSAAAATQAN